MSRKQKPPKQPAPPLGVWAPVVALAWVIPGGGHLYLKRNARGAVLMASVLVTFVIGLLMRGMLFQPETGDLLTTIIYTGGFIGNLAAGLPYFLTVWLGYAQPDVAGMVHDYGTKFLVAAGLMNVLAMVDAFEIAARRKD
ncbi:MAG TPA: DUF6677 family protein [Bryobacteraceae bacterium]|nr:DUF6677 family protein [Bryobacteraceae bacterium]